MGTVAKVQDGRPGHVMRNAERYIYQQETDVVSLRWQRDKRSVHKKSARRYRGRLRTRRQIKLRGTDKSSVKRMRVRKTASVEKSNDGRMVEIPINYDQVRYSTPVTAVGIRKGNCGYKMCSFLRAPYIQFIPRSPCVPPDQWRLTFFQAINASCQDKYTPK